MGVYLGFIIGVFMIVGALYSASEGYKIIEERQRTTEVLLFDIHGELKE